MFRFLSESKDSFIALEAVGKLTDVDYLTLVPQLEFIIAKHGQLRIFADLSDFRGWEWRAAYDDVAFGKKHWSDIERLALVGEARWESLAAIIIDNLLNAEVRYFPVTDRGTALDWACG